ncbi:MAG: hypothetical protein M1812_005702 [Candelaria pacifica]|nr:MAG: hypothetical protein M1812_005702 [Candelaria pacifica]
MSSVLFDQVRAAKETAKAQAPQPPSADSSSSASSGTGRQSEAPSPSPPGAGHQGSEDGEAEEDGVDLPPSVGIDGAPTLGDGSLLAQPYVPREGTPLAARNEQLRNTLEQAERIIGNTRRALRGSQADLAQAQGDLAEALRENGTLGDRATAAERDRDTARARVAVLEAQLAAAGRRPTRPRGPRRVEKTAAARRSRRNIKRVDYKGM